MIFTLRQPVLPLFCDDIRAYLLLQIGIDRNDVNKVFIQLTLEFLTKQVRCL